MQPLMRVSARGLADRDLVLKGLHRALSTLGVEVSRTFSATFLASVRRDSADRTRARTLPIRLRLTLKTPFSERQCRLICNARSPVLRAAAAAPSLERRADRAQHVWAQALYPRVEDSCK